MSREPELREVADGTFAYLQHGGWGFSNAGLVTSAGASLLVDTLYDLALTERMLRQMCQAAPCAERIGSVVNTHANGDHCWGNQLVGGANIISSRAAAEEMLELSPKLMHAMVQASRVLQTLGPAASSALRLLGRLGVPRVAALAEAAPFLVEHFGPFDFGAISLRPPNTLFEGRLSLRVGDKDVELIEVGPAHTRGDAIVFVPADRVVFTGDILFIGAHPIAWQGPIDNWIAACDCILDLDVDVIVPGHGPITDKQGVQAVRDYWVELWQHSQRAQAAGLSVEQTTRELRGARDSHGVREWTEAERMVVNVDTVFRELTGDTRPRDPLELLAQMARQARAAS